jgi:hypothetical protein
VYLSDVAAPHPRSLPHPADTDRSMHPEVLDAFTEETGIEAGGAGR